MISLCIYGTITTKDVTYAETIFQKTFFTILFIVSFLLLYFAITVAWHWLLPYKPLEILRTIAVPVLALVSDFAIVCAMRSHRLSRKNFVETFAADTVSFGKNFIKPYRLSSLFFDTCRNENDFGGCRL